MFDAGFLEFLVIGVIALLVIGPERLPGVARTVGGWIGKARAFVDTTKADIERELNAAEMRELLQSQKKEIDELRDMVGETTKDISQQASDIRESIQSSVESVTADIKQPPAEQKHSDTTNLTSPERND
ncbi:MAG: twin-arginine translocase subunit TatB [Proteobacteria bacterium]|nr:MAG: twin-arginine translocase subunit TatB [Pseudomonadota bacterium]